MASCKVASDHSPETPCLDPAVTDTRPLPLCVDLDGTLTPIDTLHESLFTLARVRPQALLGAPLALLRGKAAFKAQVAREATPDVETLPLNQELLVWLREQKAAGRRLVLATASDRSVADRVAARLELFDEVIASDGQDNLAGAGKREALVARFGERGFDYVGNSAPDLVVWSAAAGAVVVGSAALARQAGQRCELLRHFQTSPAGLKTWIRAARLHQWVKNLLVLAPAVLAHELGNAQVLQASLLAFLSFGLCASSVYLFNDLFDLSSDRRHARKRLRPFAAGAIPAAHGVGVGLLLLAASVALGALVNLYFLLALAAYYLFTWLYSVRLKRYALVDVMMLAGLYTMRVIAGSAATLILPSFWLLGMCVFLFLSLGTVKRYAELDGALADGKFGAHGRGYWPEDLDLLRSLGTSAGYSAVVVLALYVNSDASSDLYRHPEVLWLLCPMLLFWVSRVWMLTGRRHMHDDPIVFAIRDRISLAIAAMMGAVVLVAVSI